jgi:hypothetical protein
MHALGHSHLVDTGFINHVPIAAMGRLKVLIFVMALKNLLGALKSII